LDLQLDHRGYLLLRGHDGFLFLFSAWIKSFGLGGKRALREFRDQRSKPKP